MPKQTPGNAAPPSDAALATQLQDALRLHQTGRLNEAEAAYRAVLAASPRHFDATQLLATLRAQRGQAVEAVKLFEKALTIRPGNANVLNNLSAVLIGLGRHADAVSALKRAVAAAPGAAGSWNNLGVVQMNLGQLSESIAAFDQALQLKPDFADALANRAAAFCATGQFGEGLLSAEDALKLSPNHAGALANRGLALFKLGLHEEALTSLDAALLRSPDNADAWHIKGNALHASGRNAEAIECYRKAVAIRPGFAEAHAASAITWFQIERYAEALQPISDAVRLNGKNPDWLTVQGDVLLKLREYDKAVQAYNRADALKPIPRWRERFGVGQGDIRHMIVVIEPGFATNAGHYQRGVEGLARLSHPVPVACCTNMAISDLALIDDVAIAPFFPVSINSKADRSFIDAGRYLDAPLARALEGMRATDHLVVPSGDIGIVNALARVLARRKPEKTPQIHLRFFMVDQGVMPLEPAAAAIRALLQIRSGAKRVHIMTELPEQVDYVRGAWGIEAECVPYIQPALFAPERRPSQTASQSVLTIGFFGAGRGEKGLELIPPIIDAFLEAAPDLASKVRWIVQSSGQSDWAREAIAPVVAYSEAHPGLIELHTESLSSDAYDALFVRADIVALPYKADQYRMRSSGVAAEATFAAKPFVYSAGSSLGAFGGKSALAADTPEGFARALIQICRDFPEFAAKAGDARQSLRSLIFDSAFVERIRKPAN